MANKKNEDVRLFLQRNGINQKDLADHMGITQACVSIWLSRSKSSAHMRTTKEWFSVCESALAQRAIMSNSIGSIFALKCGYQWRETSPVGPEEIPALQHETAEQIAARHSAATLPERPDLSEFD